jgi:hypothetical protein
VARKRLAIRLLPHLLQAIKCYDAALALGADDPRTEAATRLAAARLLLARTANAADARVHLERAVRGVGEGVGVGGANEAPNTPRRRPHPLPPPPPQRLVLANAAGAPDLKCAVLAELASVQEQGGDARGAAASRGAGVAAAGAPRGGAPAAAWTAHFVTAAAAATRDGAAAAAALEAADAWLPTAAPPAVAAVALARAGAAARCGRHQDAASYVQVALDALKKAGSGDGDDPTTISLLHLQALTLRAALSLATGDPAADLRLDTRAEEEAATLAKAAEAVVPATPRARAARAAAALVGVALLRPVAKNDMVLMTAARGLEEADAGLSALGLDPDAAAEAGVPPHVLADAAPLVRIKVALLESRARSWMGQHRLGRARRDAAAALAVADAWPSATAALALSLRAMCGHYALLTRHVGEARAHFGALAAAPPLPGPAPAAASAAAAAALAALAELADPTDDGGGRAARAVAALKAGGCYPAVPPTIPRLHRTLAQLALGATLLAANADPGTARRTLASALKGAQAVVVDFQLLAHALAALGPAQAATGDVEGGRTMVASALTVAKAAGDAAAVYAAASPWADANDAAAAAWFERRVAFMDAALEDARGEGAEHAAVVGWRRQE